MEILGRQGELYQIDESLKDTARVLVEKYSEVVGHIDLQHIVFVRVLDMKLKKNGKNWLGKCQWLKAPSTLIPRYVVYKMASLGLIDMNQITGIEDELLEFNYIIMLNDAALGEVEGEDIEALVLLHELMHIPPDMEGLAQHDVQDFSYLVAKFGPYWTNGVVEERPEVANVRQDLKTFEQKLKEHGLSLSKGMEEFTNEESE